MLRETKTHIREIIKGGEGLKVNVAMSYQTEDGITKVLEFQGDGVVMTVMNHDEDQSINHQAVILSNPIQAISAVESILSRTVKMINHLPGDKQMILYSYLLGALYEATKDIGENDHGDEEED